MSDVMQKQTEREAYLRALADLWSSRSRRLETISH